MGAIPSATTRGLASPRLGGMDGMDGMEALCVSLPGHRGTEAELSRQQLQTSLPLLRSLRAVFFLRTVPLRYFVFSMMDSHVECSMLCSEPEIPQVLGSTCQGDGVSTTRARCCLVLMNTADNAR